MEQKILDTTLKTRPPDGTHWSVRILARQLGVSRAMVHRVWQRYEVKPHRVQKFKLSNDPHFEEKVRDVVGLYLNPPDRALVLCVDEKSQIQALDRTAPILPLLPGLPERQTHDYKRYGTTTLFATFNILNGKVGTEFLRFLQQLEEEVPPNSEVHLILDNYSTHKSAAGLAEAEEASALPLPLHPHQQFLGQSGGALVWTHHRAHDPPRHLPQCPRIRGSHLSMAGPVEQETPSVHLAGHC